MNFFKQYLEFLNEARIENNHFKFKHQIFDWDDNILYMNTKIVMVHKESKELKELSTAEFAEWREGKIAQDYTVDGEISFNNFRDIKGEGRNSQFYSDCQDALSKNAYAPSWKDFLECVQDGNLFMICTARGHEPITIRTVIKELIIDGGYINKELLAENLRYFHALFSNIKHEDINEDYYSDDLTPAEMEYGKESHLSDDDIIIEEWLDFCEFIGVSSPSFTKRFPDVDPSNTELGKIKAIEEFRNHCLQYARDLQHTDVSSVTHQFSFSDDDKRTIEHIKKELFDDLSNQAEEHFNSKLFLFLTKSGKVDVMN